MTEILLQYWPIIFTGGGTIVWLIRLEGKVGYNYQLMKMNSGEVKSIDGDNRGIMDRMARIETKIDLLINTLDNNKP